MSLSESSHAVFLSYASEDAEPAQKICEALRAAGIEVFLDQSELRGGDVWDQKIRRGIHACALFIPVISANTASRHEGYFRLEWDLADQRTHMMARSRVFIVPVCLDATTQVAADVPESFRRAQWTRLPGGATPAAFVERVQRLLSDEPARPASTTPVAPARPAAVSRPSAPVHFSWRSTPVILAAAAVLVLALGYVAMEHFALPTHEADATKAAAPATPTASATAPAFNPPPHSIAVLPFVNLSGDPSQDYFSDGLTEELLNSLAEIDELQVAARTSSFSFKEHADIATVAHRLNVGAVLEGSVRRSAHTIRITAQLVNASTGFHVWSKTYDRDLGDVLKLQTEIATAVASALKVTLLGDVAAKVELGGTRNPAAFDAYLRAMRASRTHHDAKDQQAVIDAYSEAIQLDPSYALAFSGRARALTGYAEEYATGAAIRANFDKAEADARRAVALAPDLAEAHLALAIILRGRTDYAHALEQFDRAATLGPGNAEVVREYGRFASYVGRSDAGIAAARRATALDPLNTRSHYRLAEALYNARRYDESVAAYQEFINLDPESPHAHAFQGLAYYGLGNFQRAREACETKAGTWNEQCLAITYDKLGRHPDAEATLAMMKARLGDAAAYQYATIYAQWGNRAQALEWLETAWRLRDPGLVSLKTDPLLDPLRNEPRFKTIERQLKFPN
jgi:TolB-like protein/Flp pilus assembly protein TadD